MYLISFFKTNVVEYMNNIFLASPLAVVDGSILIVHNV